MGGASATEPDASGRAQVVHESARTRVTRLILPAGTVIRKEPLGPDAERRLEHELAMLKRLRGVAGVVQLLHAPRYPGSLVLEDAGSTSLAAWPKPPALDPLVSIALVLARAVAQMHERGVMHRDIAPANVVMSAAGAPCLVDFVRASTVAEIHPQFTPASEIVGTLPYLAPEQTGRTARSADQRADLYALGATLYELATGAPPLGADDPLRLAHDRLARVPVSPDERNRAVPRFLSEIILHLLEKEPDSRYQSAEGLIFDLERLLGSPPGRAAAPRRVGTHDVPRRLLPPSRLVAREDEVTALKDAFSDMLAGRCRGLLISGVSGAGKTVLADELRDVVTTANGWFVAGKFDRDRRDLEFDAVNQALRALGRLLLAEPDDRLAEDRKRILRALGSNAHHLTAVVPEFAALLQVPPDPGDPLSAQVRAQRTAVGLMQALASAKRPVVLFVDDLQWAGRTPLGFVDVVLSEVPVQGLLLIAAYREDDPRAAPGLAAALARWRERPDVRHVPVANLARRGLVAMVAEMLRTEPGTAAGLVELIEPLTSGNPNETVELLNALRGEGVLRATPAGWTWDLDAVGARLDRSQAASLLSARAEALPPASRQLVEAMACLGGRADLPTLEIATGDPIRALERGLAPALADGVLVVEPGVREAMRFRHDRVREGILSAIDSGRRQALHLTMARRFAAVPELYAVAAEQYLPVVDLVEDPDERGIVAALLRRAADQVALIGDDGLVSALLSAALQVVDSEDTRMVLELRTRRQPALYGLGRLEEADEEYRLIESMAPSPAQHAKATALQVRSLTHRLRLQEALALGFEALRELGVSAPPLDRVAGELDHQLRHLYLWLERTDHDDELVIPELTDPVLLGTADLLIALASPAHFIDNLPMVLWLGLEGMRIWLEHGPSASLVGLAGTAAYQAVVQRDADVGYRALRRLLALGEGRNWEPGTSHARYLYGLLGCWVEPVAAVARTAQWARAGLIAGGEVQIAGFAFLAANVLLLDCASLDDFLAEVDAGLEFARRTGHDQAAEFLGTHRWLGSVLRGESEPPTGRDVRALEQLSGSRNHLAQLSSTYAAAAAVFGDLEALAHYTKMAADSMGAIQGTYATATTRMLRGLAVAEQLRAAEGEERTALLSELDDLTRWLSDRAVSAPDNFLPGLRWLEAERAWALGDLQAALVAFDAARREVAMRQLPRQRAMITERAARFLLAHGMEQSGHQLLADARAAYLEWGATAKVKRLDLAFPTLQPAAPARGVAAAEPAGEPRTTVPSGTVDLLGILSASQALSSETSIERLHSRLVEVLRSLTGATSVRLVLWSEDRHDWLLPGQEGAVPLSVLRYAQRTAEPVLVDDVAADERFARDPYFGANTCRSLLALPIVSRGTLRAVLVLENRLIRGAFSRERLDTVRLLAGQLAVSLDNAELYAGYRRIADEQAALRRVATLVARGVRPEVVFAAVAEEAGALFGADRTSIVRLESDGELTPMGGYGFDGLAAGVRTRLGSDSLTATVTASGRAARRDRDGGPGACGCEVAVPIVAEGRVWGVMSVGSGERLPDDAGERLEEFTALVGTAIANAETHAELMASRARIVAAADETRRRIERDLHDSAQQRLVALALWLGLAQARVPAELTEVAEALERAVSEAGAALQEIREFARGIHPAILAKGGLKPAITSLVRRSPVPVDLEIGTFGRLPDHIEISAYFIVSEALANVAKHAHASAATVAVHVDAEARALRITVSDDGVGDAALTRGTGLLGLKDRAQALGGRLEVDSPPGGTGTTLRAQLPLAPGE